MPRSENGAGLAGCQAEGACMTSTSVAPEPRGGRPRPHGRLRWLLAGAAAVVSAAGLAVVAVPGSAAGAGGAGAGGALSTQAVTLPHVPGLITAQRTAATACELPDGSYVSYYHCYTPQDIRAAYGVDAIAPITSGGATMP